MKNLADLNLIKIRKSNKSDFSNLLDKFRSKSVDIPTLGSITEDVEKVRQERHEK